MENLIGLRFGKLTVKKRAPNRRYTRGRVWECLCDCGNYVYPTSNRLTAGRAVSCGRCTKNNLIGKKFGRLVVLKVLPKIIRTDKVWLCSCECGKKIEVRATLLKNGSVKSCGCLRLKYQDREIPAINRLYARYRYTEKRKGIVFTLSKEEFISLIKKNCRYCGIEPNSVFEEGKKTKIHCVYNGIDRIDSSKGYERGNVVPCCTQCNMAKGTLSVEEFVSWGIQLCNNLMAKGYS